MKQRSLLRPMRPQASLPREKGGVSVPALILLCVLGLIGGFFSDRLLFLAFGAGAGSGSVSDSTGSSLQPEATTPAKGFLGLGLLRWPQRSVNQGAGSESGDHVATPSASSIEDLRPGKSDSLVLSFGGGIGKEGRGAAGGGGVGAGGAMSVEKDVAGAVTLSLGAGEADVSAGGGGVGGGDASVNGAGAGTEDGDAGVKATGGGGLRVDAGDAVAALAGLDGAEVGVPGAAAEAAGAGGDLVGFTPGVPEGTGPGQPGAEAPSSLLAQGVAGSGGAGLPLEDPREEEKAVEEALRTWLSPKESKSSAEGLHREDVPWATSVVNFEPARELRERPVLFRQPYEAAMPEGWRTPFSWPVPKEDGQDTLACQGIVPPLPTEPQEPITTLEDLLRPGQRVLVVAPRFGLGNVLRSFISCVFFARLTGRRIVLLHGGHHAGSFASLCEGFDCSNVDHIRPPPGVSPMDLEQRFRSMIPFVLPNVPGNATTKTIWPYEHWHDTTANVVFSANYAMWHYQLFGKRMREMQRCLLGLLHCASEMCLRTRAIDVLTAGGPSPALDAKIREVLHSVAPEGGAEGGAGVKGDPAVEARVAGGAAVAAVFDVALHVRTRDKALEEGGKSCAEMRGSDEACEERRRVSRLRARFTYLRPGLWRCISRFLRELSQIASPPGRQLSIFLATDNEDMRPEFVVRLSRHGTVYFSKAPVAHLATAATGHSGRLPTIAEFYLFGKAELMVEVGGYFSTFANVGAFVGNGSTSQLSLSSSSHKCRASLHSRGRPRIPSATMGLDSTKLPPLFENL